MPTVYEIRKLSKKIYNASSEVRLLKRGMKREVSQISSWWKGSAATSFSRRYDVSDADIERMCKKLDELQYRVNKLASALEEAEIERKKAAEKARK